jgi:hypothetical protein
MIKNVFLPLLLIILTSAGTIYFWYDNVPLSLLGLVGFITLGLGSMYISYFIFYNIFPDKRNSPLPPVQDLMIYFEEEKRKPQVFTKGPFWGTILAAMLIAGGIYSWIKLADKYRNYELDNYGQLTKAVITGAGYSKGIGTYREYQFYDNKGVRYKDKFSNETFAPGDTITIVYSPHRPIINKVKTQDIEE